MRVRWNNHYSSTLTEDLDKALERVGMLDAFALWDRDCGHGEILVGERLGYELPRIYFDPDVGVVIFDGDEDGYAEKKHKYSFKRGDARWHVTRCV